MDLQGTLASFLEASADPLGEDPRLNELGRKLIVLAKGQSKESLDELLTRLIAAFAAPHPQVAAYAALLCGCVVEEGADAKALAEALLPVVERALAASVPAWEAVTQLPEFEEEPERSVSVGGRLIRAEDLQALVNRDASSAQSLVALDQFCQPLIAALTRVPELLKTERVQALSGALARLGEASHYALFLGRLLRVPIDEEWYIIDPRRDRGFELRVSGVTNAFQVYALVHAALCGVPRSFEHWTRPLPGPAPSNEVLTVARGDGPQQLPGTYVPPFTLFRWSAVTHTRCVPNIEDVDEWYSSSAVPAELARFEGVRIGVLGDFGIKMQLEVVREFGALKARVTLHRELERRHVIELIHAFRAAPHPGRPEPGVGWP